MTNRSQCERPMFCRCEDESWPLSVLAMNWLIFSLLWPFSPFFAHRTIAFTSCPCGSVGESHCHRVPLCVCFVPLYRLVCVPKTKCIGPNAKDKKELKKENLRERKAKCIKINAFSSFTFACCVKEENFTSVAAITCTLRGKWMCRTLYGHWSMTNVRS